VHVLCGSLEIATSSLRGAVLAVTYLPLVHSAMQ